MLSSFVVRSGFIAKARIPLRAVTALQTRESSTTKEIERWDKANDIFYGPERDKKNFPHPVMPETSGKVRLGFIPDEWFQFFYPKTGVTGPYIFGTGLVAYLLSKEIWVVDHNFAEVLGFWGAFIILAKKIGPPAAKYIDERNELARIENFVKPVEDAKKAFHQKIEDSEKSIWQEDGQKYLFEAKKENVELQLEAIYRQRLKTVYDEVKKRMDYQLEMQTTKRSFEQKHMVNWIVDNVKKNITAKQEKESIAKCIADLKSLAV